MRWLKGLLIGCIGIVIAGCPSRRPPTLYTGLPGLPVHAESLYEPYLECLGGWLDAKDVPPVAVIIGGLSDKTRPLHAQLTFLSDGGPQMARTGLAKLAPRLIASTPTAFDPKRTTVLFKGQFTENDRTVLSKAQGFAIRLALKSLFGVELELDADKLYDIVTIDVELATVQGEQLPAMATHLSVIVDSNTHGAFLILEKDDGSLAASAAGKIKAVGRRHAAQRLLIYSGLYWLFSHYFGIDAQACIDTPKTDVEAIRILARTFRKMSKIERTKSTQSLLQGLGYAVGEIDGILGPRTRRAIRQFQADVGDPPTGEITAPLYIKLHQLTTQSLLPVS